MFGRRPKSNRKPRPPSVRRNHKTPKETEALKLTKLLTLDELKKLVSKIEMNKKSMN